MNLEQVVQRAKADIAKKYVYVMMPIPQLETLLAGLEEAQREIKRLAQWECEECGFLMSASHQDDDGYYDCPNCSEANLLRAISALKKENAAMKKSLEDIAYYTDVKLENYTNCVMHARSVLSTISREDIENED